MDGERRRAEIGILSRVSQRTYPRPSSSLSSSSLGLEQEEDVRLGTALRTSPVTLQRRGTPHERIHSAKSDHGIQDDVQAQKTRHQRIRSSPIDNSSFYPREERRGQEEEEDLCRRDRTKREKIATISENRPQKGINKEVQMDPLVEEPSHRRHRLVHSTEPFAGDPHQESRESLPILYSKRRSQSVASPSLSLGETELSNSFISMNYERSSPDARGASADLVIQRQRSSKLEQEIRSLRKRLAESEQERKNLLHLLSDAHNAATANLGGGTLSVPKMLDASAASYPQSRRIVSPVADFLRRRTHHFDKSNSSLSEISLYPYQDEDDHERSSVYSKTTTQTEISIEKAVMEREEKMTYRARSASPAAIRKLIQQVTQDFEREETSITEEEIMSPLLWMARGQLHAANLMDAESDLPDRSWTPDHQASLQKQKHHLEVHRKSKKKQLLRSMQSRKRDKQSTAQVQGFQFAHLDSGAQRVEFQKRQGELEDLWRRANNELKIAHRVVKQLERDTSEGPVVASVSDVPFLVQEPHEDPSFFRLSLIKEEEDRMRKSGCERLSAFVQLLAQRVNDLLMLVRNRALSTGEILDMMEKQARQLDELNVVLVETIQRMAEETFSRMSLDIEEDGMKKDSDVEDSLMAPSILLSPDLMSPGERATSSRVVAPIIVDSPGARRSRSNSLRLLSPSRGSSIEGSLTKDPNSFCELFRLAFQVLKLVDSYARDFFNNRIEKYSDLLYSKLEQLLPEEVFRSHEISGSNTTAFVPVDHSREWNESSHLDRSNLSDSDILGHHGSQHQYARPVEGAERRNRLTDNSTFLWKLPTTITFDDLSTEAEACRSLVYSIVSELTIVFQSATDKKKVQETEYQRTISLLERKIAEYQHLSESSSSHPHFPMESIANFSDSEDESSVKNQDVSKEEITSSEEAINQPHKEVREAWTFTRLPQNNDGISRILAADWTEAPGSFDEIQKWMWKEIESMNAENEYHAANSTTAGIANDQERPRSLFSQRLSSYRRGARAINSDSSDDGQSFSFWSTMQRFDAKYRSVFSYLVGRVYPFAEVETMKVSVRTINWLLRKVGGALESLESFCEKSKENRESLLREGVQEIMFQTFTMEYTHPKLGVNHLLDFLFTLAHFSEQNPRAWLFTQLYFGDFPPLVVIHVAKLFMALQKHPQATFSGPSMFLSKTELIRMIESIYGGNSMYEKLLETLRIEIEDIEKEFSSQKSQTSNSTEENSSSTSKDSAVDSSSLPRSPRRKMSIGSGSSTPRYGLSPRTPRSARNESIVPVDEFMNSFALLFYEDCLFRREVDEVEQITDNNFQQYISHNFTRYLQGRGKTYEDETLSRNIIVPRRKEEGCLEASEIPLLLACISPDIQVQPVVFVDSMREYFDQMGRDHPSSEEFILTLPELGTFFSSMIPYIRRHSHLLTMPSMEVITDVIYNWKRQLSRKPSGTSSGSPGDAKHSSKSVAFEYNTQEALSRSSSVLRSKNHARDVSGGLPSLELLSNPRHSDDPDFSSSSEDEFDA